MLTRSQQSLTTAMETTANALRALDPLLVEPSLLKQPGTEHIRERAVVERLAVETKKFMKDNFTQTLVVFPMNHMEILSMDFKLRRSPNSTARRGEG